MSTLKLEDGKYTIVHEPSGKFEALRYGEPWQDLTGNKLMLAMIHHIEGLEAQLANKEMPTMAKSTIPTGCEVLPSPHTPSEIIVSAPGSNPGSMTLTGKEKDLSASILYALAKQMIDAESQLPIPTPICDLLRPWAELAEKNQYNSIVVDLAKYSRKTYPASLLKPADPPNDVATVSGMHAALRSFFTNMFQRGVNEHGRFYMARSEGQTPDASVFPERDGEVTVHPKVVGTPFEPHHPILARYYMMLAAIEQLKRLPASEAVTGYLKVDFYEMHDGPDFVEFRVTAKQLLEMLNAATYKYELPGSTIETSLDLDTFDWHGLPDDLGMNTNDPRINVGKGGFMITDSIRLHLKNYRMGSESGNLIDLASALCHGESFYFGIKPHKDDGPHGLSEAIANAILQKIMLKLDLTGVNAEFSEGELRIINVEQLQTDRSRRIGPDSEDEVIERAQQEWELEEAKLGNLGVELCMNLGSYTFIVDTKRAQTEEFQELSDAPSA